MSSSVFYQRPSRQLVQDVNNASMVLSKYSEADNRSSDNGRDAIMTAPNGNPSRSYTNDAGNPHSGPPHAGYSDGCNSDSFLGTEKSAFHKLERYEHPASSHSVSVPRRGTGNSCPNKTPQSEHSGSEMGSRRCNDGLGSNFAGGGVGSAHMQHSPAHVSASYQLAQPSPSKFDLGIVCSPYEEKNARNIAQAMTTVSGALDILIVVLNKVEPNASSISYEIPSEQYASLRKCHATMLYVCFDNRTLAYLELKKRYEHVFKSLRNTKDSTFHLVLDNTADVGFHEFELSYYNRPLIQRMYNCCTRALLFWIEYRNMLEYTIHFRDLATECSRHSEGSSSVRTLLNFLKPSMYRHTPLYQGPPLRAQQSI